MSKILIVPRMIHNKYIVHVPRGNIKHITIKDKFLEQRCCWYAWNFSRAATSIFILCWHNSTMPTVTRLRTIVFWWWWWRCSRTWFRLYILGQFFINQVSILLTAFLAALKPASERHPNLDFPPNSVNEINCFSHFRNCSYTSLYTHFNAVLYTQFYQGKYHLYRCDNLS